MSNGLSVAHNDVYEKNGVVDDKPRDKHCSKSDQQLDSIHQTTLYLQSKIKLKPVVAVICGSGFGAIVDCMKDSQVVEFSSIPNFAVCTVPGHAGRLVFGTLGGVSLVCMQGRLHAYEEHSMWQLTFPVRVFADMGVKILVATNACGAVNADYKVGDLMIVKDHINLPGLGGLNPLVGIVDERFGMRFPFLNGAYNRSLRVMAWQVGRSLGMKSLLHEGVYLVQCGPSYETPAELRMIRTMGADVVGMSTAPEVIVARQCGLMCFGLSLVTNLCILDDDDASSEGLHSDEDTLDANGDFVTAQNGELTGATHSEVLDAATQRMADIKSFLCEFITKIGKSQSA